MRKRYIPAFIAEGLALSAMLYNLAEIVITAEPLMIRPAVWAIGMVITIVTAPAFLLAFQERRR